MEGDFVLFARDDFSVKEKQSLRWLGPRLVTKALSDYFYQVDDLRNGMLEDVHVSCLKFYHHSSLNAEAILFHALSAETSMPYQRLMFLWDSADCSIVQVRWKGLSKSEVFLEPVHKVFKDGFKLFSKPFLSGGRFACYGFQELSQNFSTKKGSVTTFWDVLFDRSSLAFGIALFTDNAYSAPPAAAGHPTALFHV